MRTCGKCMVCCCICSVPELNKKAHDNCIYAVDGCVIHADSNRPQVCKSFQCSWLRGAGLPKDRPDLSGVLCIATKPLKGEKFQFVHVFEVKEGAVLGEGRSFVERLTSLSATPIIIVDYDSKPPEDRGDRIVVKAELEDRAQRMMGKFLTYLDVDRTMGLYELVRLG